MIGHVIPDAVFVPPTHLRGDSSAGEAAQRQQFLDSYISLYGHEASAAEIEAFERRHFDICHSGES